MPHECTNCGRTFVDGSTDMLSGCPECDGNRFQYLPNVDDAASPEPSGQGDDNLIEAEPDPEYLAALADRSRPMREDRAQAAARSGMVPVNELPQHAETTDEVRAVEHSESTEEATPPSTDLEDLREQLNERFESIKIVDRGEYELNLMELYERRTCIIELQEDGRYAIEVPETFSDDR